MEANNELILYLSVSCLVEWMVKSQDSFAVRGDVANRQSDRDTKENKIYPNEIGFISSLWTPSWQLC